MLRMLILAGLVVGVLSDVDDANRLDRAGATHLLADIGELPDLLSQAGIAPLGPHHGE